MFEKFESWSFVSPGPAEVFASSWTYWGQRGYRMMSTGPSSFQGRSFQSRLGLYRVVDITVVPSGTGTVVQMRYRADVSEAGAAGGVILAVVLFPVAVVGGAISWHEYETDFQNERWAYWNFLSSQVHVAPATGTPVPQAPPPSAAVPPPSGSPIPSPAPAEAAPALPASTSAPLPSSSVAPQAQAPAAVPAPAPPPGSGPSSSPPPSSAPNCSSCGKPLAGEAKFCASCGAKTG